MVSKQDRRLLLTETIDDDNDHWLPAGALVTVLRRSEAGDCVVSGRGYYRSGQVNRRWTADIVILTVPHRDLASAEATTTYEVSMSLSSCLTADEWDACFYRAFTVNDGQKALRDYMRETIQALLAAGYRFADLDEAGNELPPAQRTGSTSTNWQKLLICLGNPYACDVEALLNNGRDFMRRNCPALVGQTDDDWQRKLQETFHVEERKETGAEAEEAAADA